MARASFPIRRSRNRMGFTFGLRPTSQAHIWRLGWRLLRFRLGDKGATPAAEGSATLDPKQGHPGGDSGSMNSTKER